MNVAAFKQLKREQQMHAEEVGILESTLGMTVAEAMGITSHHAFPVPIPLHLTEGYDKGLVTNYLFHNNYNRRH